MAGRRLTGREAGGIDRSPQHLPLAIGGLAAVHARRRPPAELLGGRAARLPALLGAAGVVAGLVFSLLPQPVPVSRTGADIHVGDSVLHQAAGPELSFVGDAALVLVPLPAGSMRAAASTELGGRHATGRCEMRPAGPAEWDESCTFRVGTERFSAVDRLRPVEGGGWRRRYSDGSSVAIPVPADGAAVPVPFPVGR